MMSRTHMLEAIWHSSSFGNERRLVFAMSKVALTDRNEERNRGIFETKEMVQGKRLVEEKLKRAAVGKEEKKRRRVKNK